MHSPAFSNPHFQIIEHAPLLEYTTFRLGGPCQGLIHCRTKDQLKAAVGELARANLDFILIGGGSNLVVSDDGIQCYAIRYFSDQPLIEQNGNQLTVSGSTILDALAAFAAESNLEGINTCSGIPGTVGGAVVGNAGAFGKQIGDVLTSATLISKSGALRKVSSKELGFRYRHSNLKESDDIVLEITLTLKPGNRDNLLKERTDILKEREEKHPLISKEPCAGSFFRNIEPTSKAGKRQATGWFLDQAGGKELTHGGAYIYPKHANIIIKGDKTTASDVFELQKKMAVLVKEKFGLDLVREVRFVGNIPGQPENLKRIIW